jgi:hypothetical protein
MMDKRGSVLAALAAPNLDLLEKAENAVAELLGAVTGNATGVGGETGQDGQLFG